MKPNISLKLILEYNLIFDDEPQPVEDYLKGIPKNTLVTAFAYFLAQHRNKTDVNDVFQYYFCKENEVFRNQVKVKYQKLEKERGPHALFSPLTLCRLFELSLESVEQEVEGIANAEIEQRILKAITAQNQFYAKLEENAGKYEVKDKELVIPVIMFSQTFPYYELVNYSRKDLVATQVIKSGYLMKFLSTWNRNTKNLLNDFCVYYGVESWPEYIKQHLAVINNILNKSHEAHTEITIEKGESIIENSDFLDKLAISDTSTITDFDFVKLRSNPLFKTDINKYIILSDLFLIETIFKGLYFKLSEINLKNKNSGKYSFPNLRSFYTDNFSERFLLYKTLEDIFHNYKYFNGTTIKEDYDYNSEPDFYVRNGNYMFLFESKDILFNKKYKHTYDYNLYEPILKERLGKGVSQLAFNVERALHKDKFRFDDQYKTSNIKIYPIIIVHDRCYDTAGLNKIVNTWFNEERITIERKGFNLDKVAPVTIINIDTLILLHMQLKDRKLSLNDLINAYHKQMILKKKNYYSEQHLEQSYLNTMNSFAHFIHQYRKPHRTHPIFEDLKIHLFPGEVSTN